MTIKTSRMLLTGSNGQVGRELQRALTPLGNVLALDRHQLDLANPDAIRNTIRACGLRPRPKAVPSVSS